MKRILQILSRLLVIVFVCGIIWLLYKALSSFASDISIAIIVGSATVLASTLAIVISRYFQAKREQEIAHRDKKIELYDEFLIKLFEIFAGNKNIGNPDDLVPFLREIQRKLILWSSPSTIKAYAAWHKVLTTGPQRAEQMISMVDFFLALRKDLGHSNSGIERSHIVRFLLRNSDLFMQEYKKNPNVTFDEIIKLEKKLGLLNET